MQTNNTILPNLINNVSENPKFSELLIKFTENSLSHPWLLSSNFFPSLLQYLTGLNDPDVIFLILFSSRLLYHFYLIKTCVY